MTSPGLLSKSSARRGASTSSASALVAAIRTRPDSRCVAVACPTRMMSSAHLNPYRQFLPLGGGPGAQVAKARARRLHHLAADPLFLFEPAGSSGELLACSYPDEQDDTPETCYLQRRGLQQKGRCVTASGRVIRTMIQSRQAIGILPEYLCQDMRSDPHFRVTELPQQREVWLLIQKHLKRDPNTRTVIDWLRSCFLRDRTTAVPQRR